MNKILKIISLGLLLISCQDDDSLTINKEWTKISDWGESNFANCIAVDGANIYVGTTSIIYHSTNNGNTWRALPTYTESEYDNGLRSIHIRNNVIFGGEPADGFIQSNDKGKTWNEIEGGIAKSETISAINSNSEYLFVGTYGLGVFRSSDNGSSWDNVLDLPLVQHIATDGNNILAFIYGEGLFYSEDNGDNWTDITGTNEIQSGSGNIYINGQNIFLATSKFYKSSDLGITWKEITTSSGIEGTAAINSIMSDGNILYATNGGTVFFSKDIGETWAKLPNKDNFFDHAFRLAPNANDHYLFGIDQYNVFRINKVSIND